MNTTIETKPTAPTRACRSIAAEDIRPGMYIAVSRSICQMIPTAVEEGWDKQLRTIDVPFIPQESGQAMKVVEVCVPFVLAKQACGNKLTLDLRRHSVVRLSSAFGRESFRKNDKATHAEGKKSKKNKATKKGKRE